MNFKAFTGFGYGDFEGVAAMSYLARGTKHFSKGSMDGPFGDQFYPFQTVNADDTVDINCQNKREAYASGSWTRRQRYHARIWSRTTGNTRLRLTPHHDVLCVYRPGGDVADKHGVDDFVRSARWFATQVETVGNRANLIVDGGGTVGLSKTSKYTRRRHPFPKACGTRPTDIGLTWYVNQDNYYAG